MTSSPTRRTDPIRWSPSPGRGWAISGVISIIAGIVVLAWPVDSIVVSALVVGVWLIILGVMEIVAGFIMRGDAKKAEEKITGARPNGI